MTRLQKDRLLKEIKRTPGMPTHELAKLIGESRYVVYDLLSKGALKDQVYAIKATGIGTGKARVRWYYKAEEASEPEHTSPTDLEIEKGVTEKDLAWQAFYRNRFLQRQQRQGATS